MDRNFENIQFEEIRKKIDSKYNDVHDELTYSYYKKKPFRDFGVLDKVSFDKLHSLIFDQRDVELEVENNKLPTLNIKLKAVLEKELSNGFGKKVKHIDLVKERIIRYKKEGWQLPI